MVREKTSPGPGNAGRRLPLPETPGEGAYHRLPQSRARNALGSRPLRPLTDSLGQAGARVSPRQAAVHFMLGAPIGPDHSFFGTWMILRGRARAARGGCGRKVCCRVMV